MTASAAAELRAALEAQEHQHALGLVGRIRYQVLEWKLERAVAARKDAERRLFDYQLDENDELIRLRGEIRRLRADNDLLRRAVLLAGAPQAREPEAPLPYVEPKAAKTLPGNNLRPKKPVSTMVLNSALMQKVLRGEPAPEPPEPGTYDPTIVEDNYGQ